MAVLPIVTVEHADVWCERCGTAQRVAVRLRWHRGGWRSKLEATGSLTAEGRLMLRLFADRHVGPFRARAA